MIDSTNEEARRRALAGDPGCLWIVAEEQTAGRGRRGRSWVSPRGNLHASALLIDPCPPALAPQLGFVAGVALAQAARDAGARGAGLKWPNDLIFGGAKCAGILVEGAALAGGRAACVVGIGVNCARAPQGLDYAAARLMREDRGAISPDELFARLMARFDEALRQWRAGQAFEAIRSAWLDHALSLGEHVTIEDGAGRRVGVFEGLDANGRLLFRSRRGLEALEAGDMSISSSPAGADDPPSPAARQREGRA